MALLAWTAPKRAFAQAMNPTPERLIGQPAGLPPGQTCQSIAANPEIAIAAGSVPLALACRPDHAAFRNMVSELGFAIAPNAMHPAHTTGFGGLAISFEANYTKINQNGVTQTGTPYWKLGTRGPDNATINDNPDSLLQLYALKVQKGLPFGLELAGSIGHLAKTSLWVPGFDLHWSLLEGFRKGALGYIPDIAIGGGVRSLTGSSKFYLNVVGLDAQISKRFTLADSAVVTPYIGYQRLLVFGDSMILDATPNVDPLDQCGYAGNNEQTGQIQCRNKLSNGVDNNGDFANNFTFERVRVHRHRILFGAQYKYEFIVVGAQFLTDLLPPNEENPDLNSSRQWTLSLRGGVQF